MKGDTSKGDHFDLNVIVSLVKWGYPLRKEFYSHLTRDSYSKVQILCCQTESGLHLKNRFHVRVLSLLYVLLILNLVGANQQTIFQTRLVCETYKCHSSDSLEKSLKLNFTRVLQKVLSLGSDYFSATFYQTYFYYKPSKYSPFTETHFCNLLTQSGKADKWSSFGICWKNW